MIYVVKNAQKHAVPMGKAHKKVRVYRSTEPRTKVGKESFPNSFWAVTIQTWTCMVVAFVSIFRLANALMQQMELNAQRDGICAVAKDVSHRILRRTMTRRSDARAASAD